jgi:uncharacterized protein (TIGR02118 family)
VIKAVSFFKRKAGMPVEEFQAYWLRTHPTAVVRLPGVRRYVQSHTRLAGYGKGEPIYDGIAELWFDDTKAMHALRGTKELEAVTADEAVFIDRATMGLILTEEHVIKDGPAPPRGVKNVEFVTRKPGLAVQDFQRYWLTIHGPLAAQIPVSRRYVQSHTRPSAYERGRRPTTGWRSRGSTTPRLCARRRRARNTRGSGPTSRTSSRPATRRSSSPPST